MALTWVLAMVGGAAYARVAWHVTDPDRTSTGTGTRVPAWMSAALAALAGAVLARIVIGVNGAAVAGAFLGASIPSSLARSRYDKARRQLDGQLVAFVGDVNKHLETNNAFDALALAAEGVNPPLSDLARDAVRDMATNLGEVEAMQRLARRIGTRSARGLSEALAMSVESGGEVRHVLPAVERAMLQRHELTDKMWRMASSQRRQLRLIELLTFGVMFVYVTQFGPLVRDFYDGPWGMAVMGVVAALLLFGRAWMAKIAPSGGEAAAPADEQPVDPGEADGPEGREADEPEGREADGPEGREADEPEGREADEPEVAS